MNSKRTLLQRICQQSLFHIGDLIRSKEQKHNLYRIDYIQYIQNIPYYHLSANDEHRRIIPHPIAEQWQHATPEEIQECTTRPIHIQRS